MSVTKTISDSWSAVKKVWQPKVETTQNPEANQAASAIPYYSDTITKVGTELPKISNVKRPLEIHQENLNAQFYAEYGKVKKNYERLIELAHKSHAIANRQESNWDREDQREIHTKIKKHVDETAATYNGKTYTALTGLAAATAVTAAGFALGPVFSSSATVAKLATAATPVSGVSSAFTGGRDIVNNYSEVNRIGLNHSKTEAERIQQERTDSEKEKKQRVTVQIDALKKHDEMVHNAATTAMNG